MVSSLKDMETIARFKCSNFALSIFPEDYETFENDILKPHAGVWLKKFYSKPYRIGFIQKRLIAH